jgi:trigger factor
LSATVKSISPVVTELTVEVPREEIKRAVDRAYSQIAKTARVRGFRKGKAPRSVLRRMYGEALLDELRGDIVANHLLEALLEHEINAISKPQLDDLAEIEEDEAYTFKAIVEVRPDLQTLEVEGIELERNRPRITDAQLDNELERLRRAFGKATELDEPRPAENGDLARIKLERRVDGKWEDAMFPDQDMSIGDHNVPAPIEEALVGMSIGDEKVVELGSKAADSEEEGAKPLEELKIHLTGLKVRTLSLLDDEFAKDVGDFETLDDLKADLAERMKEAQVKAEDQRLKSVLFDALREKNPMELPPSIVEQQKQAMQLQLMSMLSKSGEQPDNDILERMSDDAEKTASQIVHRQLLVLEIARMEELEISDEEVEAAIEERAAAAGVPAPMLKAEYGKENRREELRAQLLEGKVFAFVSSKVKITEVDPPEEEGEDSEN